MKVSINWLNEFVDISDIDVKEIAHELTMSGLEVEAIEEVKPAFTNIITARIEKINQHPNADKLHLVDVNVGNEVKTVVCGAQNIQEGQIIPYASVGSQVLDRKTGETFTLTPATIRGVESQGMLCSSDELGLTDRNYQEEDGILILNRLFDNIELGAKLEDVLHLEHDMVIDVAPTANRGDEMSVIGIAREIATLFNKPLKFSPLESTQDLSTDKFEVEIKDTDVCKYYSIGILKDIKIKASPDWMQNRLISSGIRAINNVVDITNYVLLEYGTPLHAFDFDKLNGYLCVRRANEGEKLVTLDEVERNLTHDSVLIATKDEAVCLGGVFGGANSEIDDNTKNIALEAAYFTPASNRRSARSVGYRSEASARFERGVDIEAVKPALMRAMQLLVELADAKIEGIVETGENKLEPLAITLRFNEVKRILGCEIEPERCISILNNLGFKSCGANEIAAKFEVPSHRRGDVEREIDLIEEIARINGYDKIAPIVSTGSGSAEITFEERVVKKIHNTMLSSGLNELVTTSLIGKPLLDQYGLTYDDEKAVKVANVQSEDYSMLRQCMSANILNILKNNYDQGIKNFWGYEIGRVYFKTHEASEKDTGVEEIRKIAGVITGNVQNSKWQHTEETDFYTVKGIFEKLFNELNLTNRVQYNLTSDVDIMHPYRTAEVSLLSKTPIKLGFFGELHPNLRNKMKINQPVYIFELNLEEIINATQNTIPHYKSLPQFPEVQRDIAFVIENDVKYTDIQRVIKKAVQNDLFVKSEIFDIYMGEHIKEDFKSVAFRIYMQDKKATLNEETIEAQMNSVKNQLQKSYANISFRE